jgi:hypothetical protein
MRGRYDGLSFATHDQTLGVAARAMGFAVDGIRPSVRAPAEP